MDLSLVGKRAVVCGSSQGIGRACAAELASLGADVTLVARNEAALREVMGTLATGQGQRHGVLVADFEQLEQVRRAADELASAGGGHILVHNTGGPKPGPAHMAKPEEFAAAFSMHVLSGQMLLQAMLPAMRAAKYGRVINILSTSVKVPIENLGVSNTIRAAVANWAKTLANELGPDGITVNNVLPGFTETARLDALMKGRAAKSGEAEEAVRAATIATIPARRFGRAEELAAAVAFLASPAAGYISGVNLPVDGGRTPSL